jgi:hypothetical protein
MTVYWDDGLWLTYCVDVCYELVSKIKHDLVLSDFVPDRDKLVCLLLSSCSKVDD